MSKHQIGFIVTGSLAVGHAAALALIIGPIAGAQVMTQFAAAAVAGFKSSSWIVVLALVGHGVFDAVHGYVIENAGMPAWCLAYDVSAAAGLAWLLRHGLVANDVRA